MITDVHKGVCDFCHQTKYRAKLLLDGLAFLFSLDCLGKFVLGVGANNAPRECRATWISVRFYCASVLRMGHMFFRFDWLLDTH